MTPYDFYMMSLCAWREARGQEFLAIVAVCSVISNRTKIHNSTYSMEVLRPYQFSSFNKNDPQHDFYPKYDDVKWQQCLTAAWSVMKNEVADPTNGATHYFDKTMDDKPPKWAAQMEEKGHIGAFRFFKEV